MSEELLAIARLLASIAWERGGVLSPGLLVGVLWTTQVGYLAIAHRATRVPGRPSSLGVANTVTMARGGLYAVVAGFVLVPAGTGLAWVPAICYGTGALLDRVDGLLARTVGRETALGERLDMAFDTFGFVAAPLVAVLWGVLPAWYLALSAARFVYRGLCGWRRFRGRPLFDRPDSDLGRKLAGLQMVFLTVALAPPVPTSLVATLAPFVLAPSLAVFCRDYLYVSGRLPLGARGRGN
jgi:CDP-diacylglycerol--glycerol-3-phosphate 3-phosphatidyltransferase